MPGKATPIQKCRGQAPLLKRIKNAVSVFLGSSVSVCPQLIAPFQTKVELTFLMKPDFIADTNWKNACYYFHLVYLEVKINRGHVHVMRFL